MLLLLAASACALCTATQSITVTTHASPRQTFQGFGWSLVRGGGNPFHGPLGNLSRIVREQLLTLLCEDLGTTVVRLWWTPAEDVPSTPGKEDGDAAF